MTDAEIHSLLADLLVKFSGEFSLKYRTPTIPGGSYALELESSSCIGTISIWATGAADWHVFNRHTAVEALLGYAESQSINDLHDVIVDLLAQVARHDDTYDFQHSSDNSL